MKYDLSSPMKKGTRLILNRIFLISFFYEKKEFLKEQKLHSRIGQGGQALRLGLTWEVADWEIAHFGLPLVNLPLEKVPNIEYIRHSF